MRTHASDFQSGVSELERSYADMMQANSDVSGASGRMQDGGGTAREMDSSYYDPSVGGGDPIFEGVPPQPDGVFEEMPEDGNSMLAEFAAQQAQAVSTVTPVSYQPPRKNWRTQRNAVPQWYKARQQVKSRLRSGAARASGKRAGGAGSTASF